MPICRMEEGGRRKETLKNLVATKLRTTLVSLLLNDQLENEIIMYHKQSQQKNLSTAEIEAEIQFLSKRIKQMQQEITEGRGKAYYADAIAEMEQELYLKETELAALSPLFNKERLPENSMITLKENIRRVIALLENDFPHPQSLHESVPKFISSIIVHRETKTVHIAVQIKCNEETLYQKIIVAEWPKK